MGKQEFRQWFDTERGKVKKMTPLKAAEYIWMYYKIPIIAIVVAVFVICYMAVLWRTSLRENWFYVCYGNVPATAQVGDDSDLYQEFAQYAGYDLSQKNLIFDDNCYCKPSETPYSNNYYDKLIALLESGVLDALVMESQELEALGTTGRLMDLQGEYYTIDPRWEDRLIYCDNTDESYGKDRVPIAVDLTGSVLTGEGSPYPDGCAVALNAYGSHSDQFDVFLTFLLEEAE